ncbi:MAG: UDP-N-acetylglucosamine 1-carboxyvinyltransferase [Brevinemataceae bacterium]
MSKFAIKGGKPLKGTVQISGAKNAALPILAASILTSEPLTLNNVPNLEDINTMISLLESLGKKITKNNSQILIEECQPLDYSAPYDIVSKMRASIAVMGPLLARLGRAHISMPGGCAIGPRPIDLHLKGIEELSATHQTVHGYLDAEAPKGGLIGKEMNLSGKHGSSVLATENIMMAASLAKGKTIINGSAKEPEVIDLANLLNKMGAKISGAGTDCITIEGVDTLHSAEHDIIPDRIETGTFIIAAAITGGEITITHCNPSHLEEPIRLFKQAGIQITSLSDSSISVKSGNAKAVDFTTMPYPLFPTDLQSQFLAYLTLAEGKSIITETIYPDRFMHAAEINRMGSSISVDAGIAIIQGGSSLSGASVMGSDLRGGAALVLAALAADGISEVLRIYHIDRGYENLEIKLRNLGADIQRIIPSS